MNPRATFQEARDFLLQHRTDYQEAYEGFRWPEMEEFNWALDWFDEYARGNNRVALLYCCEDGTTRQLSFEALSNRSNQVANFFRSQGVKRGDRILIMLPSVVELWEIMLAAIKIGAVVIPTTVLLSIEELRDRLDRGEVRHVIAHGSQAPKMEGLAGSFSRMSVGARIDGWVNLDEAYGFPERFVPESPTCSTDPLILYFTSGTTSKPKLVLHTHSSYPLGHLSTMYWIGLRPDDVHLNVSSPGWAKHAWSSFFAPWNAGATVFVYHYERFDGRKLLAAIQDHRVTTMCAPPTVWRFLIRENLEDFKVSLREIVSAGEPLNPNVIEAVESAWGITPRDGFGQTETTAVIGNSPGQPVKPGSMGRPLPGFQVRLLDSDGEERREGQIAVLLDPRPAGVMSGYLVDGGVRRLDGSLEGFYLTGDIALKDAKGYFTYVGRDDDVFKSSDYRISPFELESVVIKHRAVAEAAVVPSPHPTKLCVPKAFVLLAAGYEASPQLALDLFRFLREQVSPFKQVRRIEFGDLPKTVSGKIRRVELRSRELERARQRRKDEYWEEDFADELKGLPTPQ